MKYITFIFIIPLLAGFVSSKKEINHLPHNKTEENLQVIPENLAQEFILKRQVGEKCDPQKLVPQSEKIGEGFHILTLQQYPSVYDHHCFENKESLTGKWQMPDFVNVIEHKSISFQYSAYVATTLQEFSQSFEWNFKIQTSGDTEKDEQINQMTGVWNFGKNQQYHKISSQEFVYDYGELRVRLFEASLENQWPKLNPNLQKDLENLPTKYDYNSYKKFVEQYGTHFAWRLLIGGQISQEALTQKSYFKNYKADDIKTNFGFFFNANILNKKISVPGINFQFNQGTSSLNEFSAQKSFEQLTILGGIQNGLQGFNYVNDVIKNPAAIYYNFYNMSLLMSERYVSHSVEKKQNMIQFLEDYLINSKGCIDQKAINFQKNATINDGTCIHKTYGGFFQKHSSSCEYQIDIANEFTQKDECEVGYQPVMVSKSIAEDEDTEKPCQVFLYMCQLAKPISHIYLDNLDLLYIRKTCSYDSKLNFYYSILSEEQQYQYCPQDFIEVSFIDLSDPLQIDDNSFFLNGCQFKMCVSKKNNQLFSGGYAKIAQTCKVSQQLLQQNNNLLSNPLTSSQSCQTKYTEYPIHTIQITENCSITKYICSFQQKQIPLQENQCNQVIPMFSGVDGNGTNLTFFILAISVPFVYSLVIQLLDISKSDSRELLMRGHLVYFIIFIILKSFLLDYGVKWLFWEYYVFVILGQFSVFFMLIENYKSQLSCRIYDENSSICRSSSEFS